MSYKRLRDGNVKVMLSEKVFRCPYCPDQSREYGYEEESCRHASCLAKLSKRASLIEKAKHSALLEFLILEEKSKKREEVQRKIRITDYQMDSVIKQKDKMVDNFNREVKVMQKKENEQIKKVIIDYEKRELQLEEQERELRAREGLNKRENEKLQTEKKMNEVAILEQKKANDRMLKLADDHKREKEDLHQKIMELEKRIDGKQGLELEINQLKGEMIDLIKQQTDEYVEAKKKFESIKEDVKEKEEELESLKELNQALIVQQRLSNHHLQEARKELISGMKNNPARAVIGVKRMCDPVSELWNNKEERRATLKEGVGYLLRQWKFYKHKKVSLT